MRGIIVRADYGLYGSYLLFLILVVVFETRGLVTLLGLRMYVPMVYTY